MPESEFANSSGPDSRLHSFSCSSFNQINVAIGQAFHSGLVQISATTNAENEEAVGRQRFMKNLPRSFFTLGTLLSFCHLMLTLVNIAIAFVLGDPRFDDPDLPVSAIEEVANFISSILTQPMMSIVDYFHFSPNGTILEWSLFLLNSSLWGFCLALFRSLLPSLVPRA
jgi:hypothetical protein